MRILILTASFPFPAASGGALRVYGILKGLAEAGHTITLLSFHDDRVNPAATPIADYCATIATVPPPTRSRLDRLRDLLFSRQPDIARRLYSEAFAARLTQLLRENDFDLIQFEGIEVACYLPLAREYQMARERHPKARLCFDTFNAEYLLQRVIFQIDRRDPKRLPAALYSLIQAGRIRRFEGEMCRAADAVIAVSPEDADALRGFRQDGRVHVVPSGIFVDAYGQAMSAADMPQNSIVFTGKMDYRPNVDAMVWFAESVFDAVLQRVPDAHLYIVGQMPHPRLDALKAHPNITFTGWVESVQPYLQGAAVYVAPLRMGSGTRLKLLEALASRCAIVATPTAAAGLLDDVKAAMVIREGAPEIAEAVVQLLGTPAQRESLGEAARVAVRRSYDWSVLIPRLLTVYKEIGLG